MITEHFADGFLKLPEPLRYKPGTTIPYYDHYNEDQLYEARQEYLRLLKRAHPQSVFVPIIKKCIAEIEKLITEKVIQ